jgi:hypothetical protein
LAMVLIVRIERRLNSFFRFHKNRGWKNERPENPAA